jgi:sugar phosphate isomerase/epimerase
MGKHMRSCSRPRNSGKRRLVPAAIVVGTALTLAAVLLTGAGRRVSPASGEATCVSCEAPETNSPQNAPTNPLNGDKTVTIEGHRDAREASVSTKAMKYLPFDVPEGVTRITIHREFEHGPDATKKNTVDFGLFDNRGTEKGFRGWQGGSPGDFVVTGEAATCSPHALPGPLPAGRWSIAQYYLVGAPAGLGYRYTITFSSDGPKPPKAFPTPPAYTPGVIKAGPNWYAGNLHAHSLHSDGGRTFSEMIGWCEAAGFDFVASTEHNSTTAHFHFSEAARAHPNVLLLYGDEFTSPGGHANIIGQKAGHWFDFRLDPGDGRLPDTIRQTHRQGALFTLNHPFAPCTSCPWVYPAREWEQADAIEVWNGTWTRDDRMATDLWDSRLKAGKRLHAFGGTDYHRGSDALMPAAFVYADALSTSSIMNGLRRGHVILSESTDGPKVLLSPPDGDPKKAKILPGEVIRSPKTGESLRLSAHVTRGNGLFLRLIWTTGEAVFPVSGDDTTIPVELPPVNQALDVRSSGTAPRKRQACRGNDGCTHQSTVRFPLSVIKNVTIRLIWHPVSSSIVSAAASNPLPIVYWERDHEFWELRYPEPVQIGLMNNPARDVLKEITRAADFGFDFLDLTLEPPAARADRVNPERIRSALKANEMGVVGHTAYYLPFGSAFDAVQTGAITETERCLEVLSEVGATLMNLHLDCRVPGHDPGFIQRRNLEAIERLLPTAERLGITLMVENVEATMPTPCAGSRCTADARPAP